jgi:hypothetical protein
MLCCFLPAVQESTSLKELHMALPCGSGQSNLAFESMLAHTQSLQSLRLTCIGDRIENLALAAARSGLKQNTSLRELTLEILQGATTVCPILTSLHDHPHLRRLCLRGHTVDQTGLETVLLSDTSKITELDTRNSKITELAIEIGMIYGGPLMMGLTHVLQALGHHPHPTLTKLLLRRVRLGRNKARQLGMVLCNTPSLQTLVLTGRTLESAELAELAPALYRNTSIKVLNLFIRK